MLEKSDNSLSNQIADLNKELKEIKEFAPKETVEKTSTRLSVNILFVWKFIRKFELDWVEIVPSTRWFKFVGKEIENQKKNLAHKCFSINTKFVNNFSVKKVKLIVERGMKVQSCTKLICPPAKP